MFGSHYGVTGPLCSSWVRLSLFEDGSPEPQAEEPANEREVPIFGIWMSMRKRSQ